MEAPLCKICGAKHWNREPHAGMMSKPLAAATAKQIIEADARKLAKTVDAMVGPAPKRPPGRPKLHPDRKAYKAKKEAERRAKLKKGKD